MTRVEKFDTKSLPSRQPNVGAHFRKHAMEHLHWIAMEIEANRHMIKPTELFYESSAMEEPTRLVLARENEMRKIRTLRRRIIPGISAPFDENAVPQVCLFMWIPADRFVFVCIWVYLCT